LLVFAVAVLGTGFAVLGSDGDGEADGAAVPAPSVSSQSDGGAATGVTEVVIEETNNPIFDLMPTVLNGASLVGQFDEGNENNLDEALTIPAGEIRFALENVGTLAHNFEVRLPDGESLGKTKNIGPKRSGELVIELEPGNYVIACPISDHDQRGMLRALVVTAAGN
jgi:uncharacterized cupredoxin-like copper-binding protein